MNLPTANLNPFASQAKMLWHLDRLAEWKLKGDTFPVLIEVNLTNHCNEACRWCISSYSHTSNPSMAAEEKAGRLRLVPSDRRRGLDMHTLHQFLRQAKARGLRAVTWSGGGEPTTHSDFRSIVEATATLGLEQGLMTNGLFSHAVVAAVGECARWVRVSLDTLDPEKYEYQKRTKGFFQVIARVQDLIRSQAKVGVNMNLAEWNADEVLSMAGWCRSAGVDYFQVRPILGLPFESAEYGTQPHLDWQRIEPTLHEAEALSTDAFRVAISWDKFTDVRRADFGRTYSKCLYHHFICVLNADGDLCVCMYHLNDRAFSFGNIYEDTVDGIWESEKRKRVVRMCSEDLDLSTCQVCCKGHEINKFMHLVENPDPATDPNFL